MPRAHPAALTLPPPPLAVAGIPVYLERAHERLSLQALALERTLARWRQQGQLAAAAARRRPERAAVMERLAGAFTANAGVLERVRARLLEVLTADTVLRAAGRATSDEAAYGAEELLTLARRDWSQEPEAEAELVRMRDAVDEALGTHRVGRALVLGAGLGRMADELAAQGFAVHAVELSAPLAIARALLREGNFKAYAIATRNAYRALDQVQGFEARYRPPEHGRTAMSVIADATRLPHADKSIDLVLSVYFTDVVPPAKLIPEVKRVLGPGGRFVHVGPLGYHAPDAVDHLAADDLLDEFRLQGFRVSEPRWFEGAHHALAGSLHECRFHNLAFSAVSEARFFARPVVPAGPSVPFLR